VVQLTKSDGTTPRPNVKIDFTATLGANVNPTSAFTDSNGKATVSVTVPSNAQPGNSVQVQATAKGTGAFQIADIDAVYANTQDLTLTTDGSISINGYITVLPESILGALATIGASAAAFIVYTKLMKPKQKNP
jgi:hypothetical protein